MPKAIYTQTSSMKSFMTIKFVLNFSFFKILEFDDNYDDIFKFTCLSFMSDEHHSFPCPLCKPMWKKKTFNARAHQVQVAIKNSRANAFRASQMVFKENALPPSMTKSQYLADIGQSLLLKTRQYFQDKNVFMELEKLALKTSFLHIMSLFELFKIPFLSRQFRPFFQTIKITLSKQVLAHNASMEIFKITFSKDNCQHIMFS